MSEAEVKSINDKPQLNYSIFGNENLNKATVCEFVSSFLKRAVAHVQLQSRCESLLLKAEDEVVGSTAYRPVDYVITYKNIYILIIEVKKQDI